MKLSFVYQPANIPGHPNYDMLYGSDTTNETHENTQLNQEIKPVTNTETIVQDDPTLNNFVEISPGSLILVLLIVPLSYMWFRWEHREDWDKPSYP
jgi:hypothetical protein